MKQIEFEIRMSELKGQERNLRLEFEIARRNLSDNKKRLIQEFTKKENLAYTLELNKLVNDYKEHSEQLDRIMNALRKEYLDNQEKKEGGEE